MIHADGLTPQAILAELVRIPSASNVSNRPVIEFAARMLRPLGWHLREVGYRDATGVEKVNLLALPPAQRPEDFRVELALVCHTDTVPPNPAWSCALEPSVVEGNLHGCGACDVKGFLACLLAVATGMTAEPVGLSLALALTADEEVGCVGAQRLLAEQLLQPRHAIVGEPTRLHPARAGKGYCLAEISVAGKEAHSAHPALGASAIFRASRLIAQIEQLGRSLQSGDPVPGQQLLDPPYTTLNIGTIQGGTAKNIVPAECKFMLEWRPVPGEPLELVPDRVREIIARLRREDPDFTCSLRILRQQAGFETRADAPLARRWTQLSGRSAVGVPFGTEAPLLAALTGDVIVAGPGDMRTAHSEREYVPVAELDQCVAFLRELLARPLETQP